MSARHALLYALVATLFFSSVPSSIRAVSLSTVPLGITRLVLAGFGMTVWILATKPSVFAGATWRSRRHWMAMLAPGVAFAGHWLCYFQGIKLASAAIGVIGFSTYGLHLIVLGWLLKRGTITLLDLVGIAIACLGTAMLVPELDLANVQTRGLIFSLGSGLFGAFLPLIHQRYADIDVRLRTWGQFTFALPFFLLLGRGSDWTMSQTDMLLVLYLGLGVGLVGHAVWIAATTRLSTTTTSVISYLYLPMSLIFSYFAIGEQLTKVEITGAALVFLANAVTLWSQSRRRQLVVATEDLKIG